MNTVIREAVISDYYSMCEIYEELDMLHRINLSDLFIKPAGCARTEEYISGILRDTDKALFVAEIDGKVVGLAECYIQQSPDFPLIRKRKWIQLDSIAVLQEYRAHQIGSSLLKRVQEWAKAKKIRRIELKVYTFNDIAIAFYVGKGFRDVQKTMFLNLV